MYIQRINGQICQNPTPLLDHPASGWSLPKSKLLRAFGSGRKQKPRETRPQCARSEPPLIAMQRAAAAASEQVEWEKAVAAAWCEAQERVERREAEAAVRAEAEARVCVDVERRLREENTEAERRHAAAAAEHESKYRMPPGRSATPGRRRKRTGRSVRAFCDASRMKPRRR